MEKHLNTYMQLKPSTSLNKNTYENKGAEKEDKQTEKGSTNLMRFITQKGKCDE